jgi:hypothetical protein
MKVFAVTFPQCGVSDMPEADYFTLAASTITAECEPKMKYAAYFGKIKC